MNKCNFFRNVIYVQSKIFSRTQTHHKAFNRHCCVRRAVLYVPGSDEHKINKALKLKLDCIVLDCEDGVAANMKVDVAYVSFRKRIIYELHKRDEELKITFKADARKNIADLLDKGPVTVSDPEWSVRVNAIQTPELFQEDMDAILSANHLPSSICLPKVNSVDQLQWFAEKVWNNVIKRPENDRGPIKLIMLIESAIAVMKLPELCKKAEDLATMAPIVPVAVILGGDDLLADLGATKTQNGIELLYVRQKLVLVAKAFGLQAIDTVYTNFKDSKGFSESCLDGVLLGYTGKQVIHPDQVVIAQEKFVPSRSKIQWAKKIIKAFQENQEKGQGAFSFENHMIDMPTVRQAENILKTAKIAGKLE